jgi:sugar (pentulose or hexulose) kinase
MSMCLRWFRDHFCENEIGIQEITGIDAYYLMDREAEKVAPGSDGLVTLPHLQGAMAPDVNLDAKGVFYGMTLQHTKAHFIRSIMESLGYIICRNLEAIGDMGLNINEIRTMGGGSKSDVWNQIKSDITGKTLYLTYSGQDTACLGAAILAGTAAGIFKGIPNAVNEMVHIRTSYKPNENNHQIYKKQYKIYCKLFQALGSVFEEDAGKGS